MVTHSDLKKQQEQLGENNMYLFKWIFSENGLISYYNNEKFHEKSIIQHYGEKSIHNIINKCLGILATIDIPKKRRVYRI